MKEQQADIRERLVRAGIRCTRKRLELSELLFGGPNRHVTAEVLWKEAHEAGIKVSLATVYNTLNEFEASGILSSTIVDAERTVFDTNMEPHHHAVDVVTGNIIDLPLDSVEISPDVLPYSTSIESVQVVIRVRAATDNV